VDVLADPAPHGGGVLDLVHHASQVVPKHPRAHRLATGFEERHQAGDDRVQGPEAGD
jgi:hypothetical protein